MIETNTVIAIGAVFIMAQARKWIHTGTRITIMIEAADYNRGYDSGIGIGRRAFDSGYCRNDHNRGDGDCYEDKCDRYK